MKRPLIRGGLLVSLALSFAVAQPDPRLVHVSPSGSDAGDGSAARPFKTLAKAASVATSGQTIQLAPGTYVETKPAVIALGVNVRGAGEDKTFLESRGVELAPGVDPTNKDFKLWYDGSLIQLVSAPYPAPNPRYGQPSEMLPAQNGNQVVEGFTIEGFKSLKAGVWVENRSNVTLRHVTFKNLAQRGAVLAKGDMWWYEALPEGMWMKNTVAHDLTFVNAATDLADESLGALNLGGLDGADIHDIDITENLGYGIKFIFVGHFRNVKIHDARIRVPERDDKWGEDASIELWNLDAGNEVHDVDANTWFSFVNQWQIVKYLPPGDATSNLRVYRNRIVDEDGLSGKEAMEVMLSGVEIFENYVQDKGFGVAVWGVQNPLKNYKIHHNVFANVRRAANDRAFGESAAVFVPDVATNFEISNNVFDTLGNALSLEKARGVVARGNVFLDTDGLDVRGGQDVTFSNNLKFSRKAAAAWKIAGAPLGGDNALGDPGFRFEGARPAPFYAPSSAASLAARLGVGAFPAAP